MNDLVGVYAVFDHKSKTYDLPFFARNEHIAARRFVMDCRSKDERALIAKFKDDFELRYLCSYNMSNGEFKSDGSYSIVIQGKEVTEE